MCHGTALKRQKKKKILMDFTHLLWISLISQISQGFLAIFSSKCLILVKRPTWFTGWVRAWRLRVLSHDEGAESWWCHDDDDHCPVAPVAPYESLRLLQASGSHQENEASDRDHSSECLEIMPVISAESRDWLESLRLRQSSRKTKEAPCSLWLEPL